MKRWVNCKPIDEDAVVSGYKKSESILSIATQAGVTVDRIRRVLKKRSVVVLTKSEFRKKLNALPFIFENDLIADYASKQMTVTEVCMKYKISREKLNLILVRNKVDKRTHSSVLADLWASGAKKKNNPNGTGTKDIFGAYFNRWKCGATARGLEFEISKDEIQKLYEKQGGICAYTSVKLVSPISYKENKEAKSNPFLISLDRIDSELGYVNGNCQLVCSWVNKAKGGMEDAKFREIITVLKQAWGG
jgi:hypothetical protein